MESGQADSRVFSLRSVMMLVTVLIVMKEKAATAHIMTYVFIHMSIAKVIISMIVFPFQGAYR